MTETESRWKQCWTEGFQPLISTRALEALADALRRDDDRLIQGATTVPPPLQAVMGWSVEAACAVGYCGWQGEGLKTVDAVETYFARLCYEVDQRLNEPAGCRWMLCWWDETPRQQAGGELLEVIEAELERRRSDA